MPPFAASFAVFCSVKVAFCKAVRKLLIARVLRLAAKLMLSAPFSGVCRNAKLRYFQRKSKVVKAYFVGKLVPLHGCSQLLTM